MKVNNQPDIQPAQRLDSVQEYYFSRKGKEVARMNAEGKDIISLAIGSPDMPPSQQTIDTLCREAQNPNAHAISQRWASRSCASHGRFLQALV